MREWFRGGPGRQRQPLPPKSSFVCTAVLFALQFVVALQLFLHLVWLVWHLVWLVWLVSFELSAEALASDPGESGLGEVQGGSANHYDRKTVFVALQLLLHCSSVCIACLFCIWSGWSGLAGLSFAPKP